MLIKVLKDAFKKTEPAVPSQPLSSQEQTAQSVDMERIRLIEAKANSGDLDGAEALCLNLRAEFPTDVGLMKLQQDIHLSIAARRFPGVQYEQWLAWFHTQLMPQNYLEIGVESGNSMRYAKPPTRVIGIDPGINITFAPETWIKLFKLPSDEFFERHTPSDAFGGGNIDFAFIDGLHTFDQTLRDFINVERHANPNSVVLIHDIFPVAELCAARERNSVLWVGDTWKMMILLRKHRPDLQIFTIPTFPSGLAVVTKLNPHDGTLRNSLESLYLEALGFEYSEYFPILEQQLNAVSNDFAVVREHLGKSGVSLSPNREAEQSSAARN